MLDSLYMRFSALQLLRNSILLISLLSLSGVAIADRPEWAGHDGDGEKAHKHGNKNKLKYRDEEDRDRGSDERDNDRREYRHHDREQSGGSSIEINIGGYFGESQRSEAHEYYRERYRSGHCPPGLAKKHNGCVAPGHDREWVMGKPLSKEVKYQSIDPAIKIKLGLPPEGHKFVRVASDILLIAVGTGMVVDAIQDIGQ